MILHTALLAGHSFAADPAFPSAIAPEQLVGTYEMQLDIATNAKVPIIGETLILSRQKMLAHISYGSGGLVVHHATCTLAAKTKPALAATKFPVAFVDAIPDKTYPLELSGTSTAWTAHMDLGGLPIGFDPSKSATPPSSIDHPAVYDWDNDGKPAATVHLEVPLFGTIEVYQAQTARAVLDGKVVSADKIEGGVRVIDFYQRTLSASNRLFIQNPVLTNNAALSTFRLSRIADQATCLDIPAARVE